MDQSAVRQHFLATYVAEDGYDGVYLRETNGRACGWTTAPHGEQPEASVALVDVEDEASGGFPMCLRCFTKYVLENPSGVHVKDDPERTWQEVEQGGTWFLYAPPGTYSKDGVWPYEGGQG